MKDGPLQISVLAQQHCHPLICLARGGGHPVNVTRTWIPVFTGMTTHMREGQGLEKDQHG